MGQNLVVAVCPYSGNNQNDSIVLNAQSLQRGIGANLAFHTTRFDVHAPYHLSLHPDIPGPLGLVLPGAVIQPGTLMVAARREPPAAESDGVAAMGGATEARPEEAISRAARLEDVGIVHRVVVTNGNDGYVITNHHSYSLATWAPIPLPVLVRRLTAGEGGSPTMRITTVSLREVRVGDKFASRHGQKGTVGGVLVDQTDMPYTADGMVPDLLFGRARPGRARTRAQLARHPVTDDHGPDVGAGRQQGDGPPGRGRRRRALWRSLRPPHQPALRVRPPLRRGLPPLGAGGHVLGRHRRPPGWDGVHRPRVLPAAPPHGASPRPPAPGPRPPPTSSTRGRSVR